MGALAVRGAQRALRLTSQRSLSSLAPLVPGSASARTYAIQNREAAAAKAKDVRAYQPLGSSSLQRRSFSSSSLSHGPSSSSSAGSSAPKTITVLGQTYETDDFFNVPPSILSRLGPSPVLPYQSSHPLELLRTQIESTLSRCESLAAPSPIVSAESNFDDLGIAPDHPGRSPTDTYYINRQTCLRTHTSAHEVEFFKAGKTRWLLTADVYRRDEIDASHYPIFHQMEGASNWSTAPGSTDFEEGGVVQRECEEMEARLEGAQIEIEDNVSLEDAGGWQKGHEADPIKRKAAELALRHLKATLNGLAYDLFGDRHAAEVAAASAASAPQGSTADASNGGATSEVGEPLRVRWISAFFPFTSPSFEVEVWFRGQWLEILGCGISQQSILDRAAVQDRVGWAFGLGLERIAMVLYSIPDIRLFWSKDERFLKQFQQADQPTKMPKVDSPEAGVSDAGGKVDQRRKKLVTFRPYSKFPSCHKDVSFWLPKPDLAQDATTASSAEVASPPSFHENDLMELIRETAADLAEDVKLIDSFSHPKTGRVSKCYRINYRSMERSLENEEVNALHDVVVQRVRDELGVEIR